MDHISKAHFILLATDNGKHLAPVYQCLLEQFTVDAGLPPPSGRLYQQLDELYDAVLANRYEYAKKQFGRDPALRTLDEVVEDWGISAMENFEKRRGYVFDSDDIVF